ncbi:MAG: tRNA dihydrouridine synthase DusB [Methanobrevibacter sp.]|uniref:tRNA dihydrouridine synthase DusB n=1 Tax=Methanobrevibacter sp. TaxID=66852 RepID=UPI0025E5370F|nr:tRNA dihydrouridine synthase DusB [Methanobrevibacter sp.]MBQ6099755.1 tRNA dihydrouridine synthase DusB [Methanobrevibacter sp.]
MKWKIGNVEIDNQVVLAPMAGICDSAFRRIAKSMGCGLIETEMVSAKSLMYDNWKTKEMLYMTEEERPISQQIFGAEAESFKIASEYIAKTMNPDIIDINMGCPVTKVAVKSNSGSALLKSPEKIEDIVKTVVDSVDVPVTVKIRSGWDRKNINAIEVAGIIEDAGASAITVHPRTREDRYDIPADWSLIKDVKDAVSIPVIGNGDIWTCHDASKMIDETGCDAIMLGRAVRGNPWLIKQCIDYLDYGIEPQKVTLDEKITMIKKHVDLLSTRIPEKVAVHKMRTHAAYYLKNSYRSGEIKPKLFKIHTKKELYELLEEYRKSIAR